MSNAPPATHPVDAPEFAGQRALYRTAAAAMVAVLVVVSAGFGMVVTFTLGGVALVGNRFQVAGVPVPTLAAFLLTPLVAAGATLFGRARLAAAAQRPAHPELAGGDARRDRLMAAVGAGLFATQAVLLGFGFLLAVAFHLTASTGILACVGLVALSLCAHYPTAGRVRADYDRAARLQPGGD